MSHDARYAAALDLLEGRVGDRDPQAALAEFRELAALGHAEALWQLGLAYYPVGLARVYGLEGSYVKAHASWLKAAEGGHRQAMARAAADYSMGWSGGVPRDYAKAVAWSLRLIDGDDQWAMSGMLELASVAMKQRQYPAAAAWYERAALRGDAYALSCLTNLIEEQGVPSRLDAVKRHCLDVKAATRGDHMAHCRLASSFERGEQAAPDPIRALAHFLAARQLYDEPKGRTTAASEGVERLRPLVSSEAFTRAEALAEELLAPCS